MFEPHPNSSNNSNNIRAANLKSDLLVLVKNKGTVREFAYERVKAPVFKKHLCQEQKQSCQCCWLSPISKKRVVQITFCEFCEIFQAFL